jgi:hypothetical protein
MARAARCGESLPLVGFALLVFMTACTIVAIVETETHRQNLSTGNSELIPKAYTMSMGGFLGSSKLE